MEKLPIAINELLLQPFTAFGTEGILVVSGTDVTHANPMTISWGMFGIMWGRPIMMVMIRHSRHTWNFIANAVDFSVNWMPDDWTDAVRLCGQESGKNIDKFAATGMTPLKGAMIQAPVLAESALSLECKIVYHDDLHLDQFTDPAVLGMYADNDIHTLFFGEVVAAVGVKHFHRA